MKQIMMAIFIGILTCAGLAYAEEPEVYRNPGIGFQITKPADWHYITTAQIEENLKNTKLDDEEFHQAMQKYATTPLFAVSKFPEPYDDLNPSLNINILPLGQLVGKNPTEILALTLPALQRALKNFELVQPPIEVNVAGIKSAYSSINFTMETPEGKSFPTVSELWIVPRGDYFFMIGAGTRQDEKTGTRAEIHAIIDSIVIEQ